MPSPVPRSRYASNGAYPAGILQTYVTSSGSIISTAAVNGGQNRGYSRQSVVVSKGHPRPYSKGGGGNFLQVSYESNLDTGYMSVSRSIGAGQSQRWSGYPTATHSVLSEPIRPSESQTVSLLSPWGAKGWNRARPVKPILNINQFLGELRQIPRIPGSALMQAIRRGTGASGARRAFGSEYLNVDFGIRPLADDLRKILKFEEEFAKAMAQAVRDERKGSRRRRTLKDSTDVATEELSQNGVGYMYHPFSILAGTRSGRTVTTTTEERIWFVGKFRYKLPDYKTPGGMDQLRRYMAGSHQLISSAWELTPWSWMADWVGNVGDVLANFDNQNAISVAAEYAYVMRTYKQTRQSHCWVSNSSGSGWSTHTSTYTVKSRVAANPYGFGVTWSGLNDSRIATLAALGLQSQRW